MPTTNVQTMLHILLAFIPSSIQKLHLKREAAISCMYLLD